MKFWQTIGHVLTVFFVGIWTFVQDHFTDKSGFWDEKRTTAFALLCLGVWYGIFQGPSVHPDPTIFGILMGAGVGQYFSSAYNDGRNPGSIAQVRP